MSEFDVDKLRQYARQKFGNYEVVEKSADEIDRLKAEIKELQAKMDHMVVMKRKINREVVAELREVRVNPDECYFPPVTLARRAVQAEAEIKRLRGQLDHALDALLASHGGCRMPSIGDECDCGLCKRDRKITDLQAIVDNLDKTADNVPGSVKGDMADARPYDAPNTED